MDPQQQPSQQPVSPQPQQPPAAYSRPTLVPEPQMATPPETTAPAHKKSIKMPIILMAWPTVALILVILLYALANLLAGSPTDGDTFGETNPIKSVLNVLLFIIGGSSVLLGPISFIIGLVLLIVRKTK
jgi:hypothetical protein